MTSFFFTNKFAFIKWTSPLFFMALLSSQLLAQTNSKTKPNILVILTDDMGYSDIGAFGSEINTPNIDRLAKNGITYNHFYNTARCSPSRASLLTGLYPHQAAMGYLSSENFEEPGYTNDLSKNAVTMAEVFKNAGYATYMTGKWHLAKSMKSDGDKSNWPLQRGFERYFGTLNGSGSYFDPGTLISNNTFIAPGKDFYYTNAIADTTVKFINENPKGKPFFFYVAFTAAHWPLHAPEKDIAKYKGKYDMGWDVVRKNRFEKLKRLGIINKNCVLTERGIEIPAWENEPMKKWQTNLMEVYAAMIDVMDQGVGKIITALEKNGQLDNTVIFYMHDNGGCAETLNSNVAEIPATAAQSKNHPYAADSVFTGRKPEYSRAGNFIRSGKGVDAGSAESFMTYGVSWANVSNTPYRLYKHWTHEGGIASPLIIHWPKGIKAALKPNTSNSHLIDIMATCLEITKVSYPTRYNNQDIQPYEGKSLVPTFTNKIINRPLLFWEHNANRAIRVGDWKLVSQTKTYKYFTQEDEASWELFNLNNDPTELINLATRYPEKVKTLAALWEKEAIRTKAKPWPWGKKTKAEN